MSKNNVRRHCVRRRSCGLGGGGTKVSRSVSSQDRGGAGDRLAAIKGLAEVWRLPDVCDYAAFCTLLSKMHSDKATSLDRASKEMIELLPEALRRPFYEAAMGVLPRSIAPSTGRRDRCTWTPGTSDPGRGAGRSSGTVSPRRLEVRPGGSRSAPRGEPECAHARA